MKKITLLGHDQDFWKAGVGGKYQGTVGVILIILVAVDLHGFGEWGQKTCPKQDVHETQKGQWSQLPKRLSSSTLAFYQQIFIPRASSNARCDQVIAPKIIKK